MKKCYCTIIMILIGVLCYGHLSHAEEVMVSGIIYRLDEEEQTCSVSGFNETQMSANVSIPATITQNAKIYKVIGIREYSFFECEKLESITLPSSVLWIGSWAFEYCKNLKTISLQEGLEEIDLGAFESCSSLQEISIPASVSSIEGNVFKFCNSLTEIKVKEGNGKYYDLDGILFFNSRQTPYESFHRVLMVYPGAKKNDTFMIEEDMSYYDDFPFLNCQNLKEIIVDPKNEWYSSVDGVLYNKEQTTLEVCPAGKTGKVDIPEGVELIGFWSFYGSRVSEIVIPDSVTNAAHAAFAECKSVEKLSIGKGYEYIYNPNSRDPLEYISECKNLYSITVSPENKTLMVENGVLYTKDKTMLISCTKAAKKLELSANTTTILESAFNSASNIDTVSVSSENEYFISIDGILYKHSGTTLVFCPKTVTKVAVSSNVDAICDGAFDYCSSSLVLMVEEDSHILEYAKEHGLNYEIKAKGELTTEQSATNNPSSNGSIAKDTLPTAGTQKTISSVVYKVTKSTASQKEVTFVKPTNSKKTSITIPSTVTIDGYTYKVTEIAPKAFKNNKKVKSVTIGKNVKKIGKETFYNCKNLKKITIKSSVLKSVGKNAIKNINKKATIKVPKKQLKAYKKLFKSKTGYKKTMKIKK